MKKLLLLFCFTLAITLISAQITLPRLFRDSMILQRDVVVPVWGWASPKEKITIAFNGKKYKANANENGDWKIALPATKAGGPYSIEISGKNKIVLKDVLFGDVWFCSGQSNMVHQLNIHDVTYAKDIAEANDPDIRQFWVPTLTNLSGPQKDLPNGYWKAAVGEDVRPFSAVAYFFAKKIHDKYKVPVGIINASVGGTPIEAWLSEEGLKDFEAETTTIVKNKDTAYINAINRNNNPNTITPAMSLDEGMVNAPKWSDISYTVKGWRNINIPGYWEDQGVKDLNGIVWYRKEIDIPASITGKAARLFLGRIVDADECYINGKLIGKTGYQYPQRRYTIPPDILKAGKNIFVVRVTNINGKGGFVPDKPYCIISGTDTIDLKGTWQYKVGLVSKPLAGSALASGGISAQNQPTALYNAMVAHAIPYVIKGICWYQGESNTGKPLEYQKLLPALIYDWRTKWKNDSLPFLYVQLPGFMDFNYTPSESNWALLREAQCNTLGVPHTAMTVAIDLGEWNDVHPDNKKEVGERMALSAFKVAYNENLLYSGPQFQSATINGTKIVLSFSHTGSGLATKDGEALSDFAIAGTDKKFVWAKAIIEGEKIVVWADEITAPLYVRYAWADNPINPNLFNKEVRSDGSIILGLPASPFRTDN